ARTDLNRRPTGYEPVALSRTKLRAHREGKGGAAERSLGAAAEHRRPFEPLTFRLTADRSTAELRRHRGCRAGIALIAFPARRRPVLVLDGAALEVLDDRGHPFEGLVRSAQNSFDLSVITAPSAEGWMTPSRSSRWSEYRVLWIGSWSASLRRMIPIGGLFASFSRMSTFRARRSSSSSIRSTRWTGSSPSGPSDSRSPTLSFSTGMYRPRTRARLLERC